MDWQQARWFNIEWVFEEENPEQFVRLRSFICENEASDVKTLFSSKDMRVSPVLRVADSFCLRVSPIRTPT